MIAILFKNSRSPKFNDAVKSAKVFENNHADNGDCNKVDISMKEIFEKWESFNHLFWTVLTWKGTVVEYDGMQYHSTTDKTSVFYALQQAHNNWVNYTKYKLSNIDQVYTGRKKLYEIEGEYLTNEQVNSMIDDYVVNRSF